MRRPAALFFLLIFSATLSNAHQRGPINAPPAASAHSHSASMSSSITPSTSATSTKVPTKRYYKANLKVAWACAASNAKVSLTHKSSPDFSIQRQTVKLPKKASKSVVTPHACNDGHQSRAFAQFKGQKIALYSPQLCVGNSSPTANKPPGV